MLIVLAPTLLVAAVAGAVWWLHGLWTKVPRSNADFGMF